MRPLHLVIEGLRSYRDAAEIDFATIQLSALIGDTGAGKSSIIEAITVALYNRPTWPSSGRNVQALRADGSVAMRVVLTFSVGPDETWTVTRVHRAGTAASIHKLECVETAEKVDGERAINARIVALIGLEYEQFIKAVVIPQGQFAKLLEETDANRTRTLKGIFRLDHLSGVKNLADGLIKRFAGPVGERRGRRSALPPDPAGALAAATDRLASAEGRAEALGAAISDVTVLHSSSEELSRGAAAARDRAAALAARIDPTVPSALRTAAAAATAISAAESAARIEQEAALSAQQEATAAAGAALRPFSGRDEAVRARVTLESSAQVEAEIAARADVLRDRRQGLDDADGAVRRSNAAAAAGEAAERATLAGAAHGAALSACADAEQRGRDASSAAKVAASATAKAEAAVASARKTLDAAQHGNALVVVAGGRGAGDDCPVCHRTLPAGYTPPSDPGIEKARTRLATAEDALAAARAALETAESARDVALAEVAHARQAADARGHEREAAERAAAEADRERRRLDDDHQRAAAELLRDEARLAEDRRRAHEALASLPAGAPDAPAIAAALAESERLTALAARHGGVAAAAADRVVNARGRLDVEVNRPVATALAAATALAREVSQFGVAVAPGPDGGPEQGATDLAGWASALAAWAGDVVEVAAATGATASEEADDLERRAVAAAASAAARCRECGASDAAELRSLASSAEGAAAVERHQVAALETAVTEAQALDAFLAVGEPFLANLEVLSQTMTDGRFIRALVAERERELLVEASRKLRELTRDNFGFGEAFRIVDRRTGQQRAPETLSGGERFLASLALALGLVEIATRGGGQLDALFLDEGFGSLDSSSLDQALATLGGLAVGGKLVVLVSHLRRVAEHVDDVLLVTRDDTTGSRVRKLGPDERDALLADDARAGLTL